MPLHQIEIMPVVACGCGSLMEEVDAHRRWQAKPQPDYYRMRCGFCKVTVRLLRNLRMVEMEEAVEKDTPGLLQIDERVPLQADSSD